MGLEYRQVSHQDHEYAKRVADTPGSLSNWGGTQAMDRWWLGLRRFIPASLNRKKKNSSFSGLHPHIPLLLFFWTWRTHVLRGKSPAEILHLLPNIQKNVRPSVSAGPCSLLIDNIEKLKNTT